MSKRRFAALAGFVLASVTLNGCSSPQSASSDRQFQMVRITDEMLDGGRSDAHQPLVQLGASDDWGLMVYDYYLAHKGQYDQGDVFVEAKPEVPID